MTSMNKLIKLICISFIFLAGQVHSGEFLVCIHGFMRTYRVMSRIEKAFEKSGWEVLNWDYPSRDKRIEEHAEDLVVILNEIACERPGEPIHFVTHSLGGIIVRAALNHPNCPKEAKIGKAVLIAPPNQGAIFARKLKENAFFRWVMGDQSGYELMNAPNFKHLGPFPETKEVLIIAGNLGFNPYIKGSNDGKVAVDETLLNTPHEHTIVGAGHSWISISPKVIRLAKSFLIDEREEHLTLEEE